MGKVYCVDGEMSVYRRNIGGWTMNKPQLKLMEEQYIHFNALIESFPNLNLKYLNKKKIRFASYLNFYGRTLPFRIKKMIKHDIKSYPILFIFYYIKYILKFLIGHKS